MKREDDGLQEKDRREEHRHQEEAGRMIHIVSHQLKRSIFLSGSGDSELTNMQNRVLHYILRKNTETSVYQKDIEKEFHIRKSTATEILQLMEKNGFLYRECSQKDGRMKKIIPTDKALEIHQQVINRIGRVEKCLKDGIDEADYQTCLKVLRQMSENLTRYEANMT